MSDPLPTASPLPGNPEAFLRDLRAHLAGCDRAMVQDAVESANARILREGARVAWEEPALPAAEAFGRVLAVLGTPEAFAEAFRNRERLVAETLRPMDEPRDEGAPEVPWAWPGFFGILAEPLAYTSLLYLLLSFLTGIFYWTWVSVGLALSLGLVPILVGLPLLVLFLGSVRALGVGEGRLVEALLGVRMPRRMPVLPQGRTWMARIGDLFRDGFTWRALAFLLLQMPIAILTFTSIVSAFSVSLACLAIPFVFGCTGLELIVGTREIHHLSFLAKAFLVTAGTMGLVASLHLVLGLGRLHGSLAKGLLVKGRPRG